MKYKTYRMYRGKMTVASHGGSGYFGGSRANNFSPTARIFKGRTIDEATRKMDKFIREAQIVGSFFVQPIKKV